MFNHLKQNSVLILSIIILLSPLIYINRTFISNIILHIQDQITPVKPGTAPWLSTRGNQIIDSAGQPVLLRGVNISSNQRSEDGNY